MDFVDKDGSRIMQFQTPCGFDVVLIRRPSGSLTTLFYFEHMLINKDVAMSRLHPESKRLLDKKIMEINA